MRCLLCCRTTINTAGKRACAISKHTAGRYIKRRNKSAFAVQTINGIKWKTLSAGIGVGIDNYVFRTVPVFADIRADILKRKNTPFVFIDAGPQFCWVQNNQKASSFYNPNIKPVFILMQAPVIK